LIYWLIWGIAHVVVRVLYRVSYSGGEKVPRSGAVLICANHLGWWDPIILAIACRRRVYFMAKAELWDNLILRVLLPLVGAFPVRRGTPDRRSLTRALELLDAGQVVGIFPEGSREPSGVFRRAEPGVGLLVLKAGVPVVPGYFQGPYGFRRRVTLTLGEPLRFEMSDDDGRTGAQKRQMVADAVMRQIAVLGGRGEDYPFPAPEEASEVGLRVSNTGVSPGPQ